ncbi:MAG: hypothetical protein ACTSSH_14480 [Candidatus Heimdallarchaeota archaeon]
MRLKGKIDEHNTIQHKFTVKAAEKLKGNIPDDKMRAVLGFISRQLASQDKRCQEIRNELAKYLAIK